MFTHSNGICQLIKTAMTLPAVSHQRAVMFEVLIALNHVYWVCVCASVPISPCWPLHGAVGRHLQCSHWSDQIDVCRPHRSCCHFPLSARPPAPSPQGGHTDRSPVTRVKLSRQTPNGQGFPTCNGFLYERGCCTRMYWNSSTGESGPEATALRPSNRECFLVMRRSLFLMAATILSSEPWCVLIEYRWQPGTEEEETQVRDITSDVSFPGAVPTMDARSRCKGQNTSSEMDFHTFHGLFK